MPIGSENGYLIDLLVFQVQVDGSGAESSGEAGTRPRVLGQAPADV